MRIFLPTLIISLRNKCNWNLPVSLLMPARPHGFFFHIHLTNIIMMSNCKRQKMFTRKDIAYPWILYFLYFEIMYKNPKFINSSPLILQTERILLTEKLDSNLSLTLLTSFCLVLKQLQLQWYKNITYVDGSFWLQRFALN